MFSILNWNLLAIEANGAKEEKHYMALLQTVWTSYSFIHDVFFYDRFSLCSEPSCLLMEASVPLEFFTRDC